MKTKAVIFDMDGTITRPYLDFDTIRAEIGIIGNMPILEAMQLMPPQQKDYANNILLKYDKLALETSTINDGVHDTMQTLRSLGIKTAILTRNLKSHAVELLSKHNLNFDIIVDRDAGPAKPDPFGVYLICDTFGINPSQAIIVGDYIHDIETARNAGSIAVLFKSHKNADEFALSADYAIDHFNELIEIVQNN